MTTDDSQDLIAHALDLNEQRPRRMSKDAIALEKQRCAESLEYFIRKYCRIYDNLTAQWIVFDLWPSQVELLQAVEGQKYSLIPKARQLGVSWLLGDVRPLWRMICHPIREILIFSQRDDEAMKLLERLRGTYERLPDWLKPGIETDSAHEFKLTNGSRVQALPAGTGGRSNAASDVIIDEADFITNLKSLITAAKPTIDAGENQMVVLSTINEETPNSYFQQLCKAAARGDASWAMHFLGWRANPNRTDDWYETQKANTLVDNGTLDPLYKEYPATLAEALAPRELNKRFPPDWIMALSEAHRALPVLPDTPAIAGLKIYRVPQGGKRYGIGFDPGGGKVDPSVAIVVDADSKEQCAVLSALIEPTQAANQVTDLSDYYNRAPILFELNNHGHAALAQFKERSAPLRYGIGKRGQKDREPGWLTTERSKHMLFDVGANVMRDLIAFAQMVDSRPEPILFDTATIAELTSIEVSTLEAPEGMHDDHAMAWVLAMMAVYKPKPSMEQVPYTGLWTPRAAVPEQPVPYHGPGSLSLPKRPPSMPASRTVQPPPFDPEDVPVPKHIEERFGRFRR